MLCGNQTTSSSELLESKDYVLAMSPEYDLLATQRLINDPEESALNINGNRSKLRGRLYRPRKIPEN